MTTPADDLVEVVAQEIERYGEGLVPGLRVVTHWLAEHFRGEDGREALSLSPRPPAQNSGGAVGDGEGEWLAGQTGSSLAFDDGILNINRDGSGNFCFRDEVLGEEWADHNGKLYRYAGVPHSELAAIRDELNKRLGPGAIRTANTGGAEVLEEALRVFDEELVQQATRLGAHSQPAESPGAWRDRVRRAAIRARAALTSTATQTEEPKS